MRLPGREPKYINSQSIVFTTRLQSPRQLIDKNIYLFIINYMS